MIARIEGMAYGPYGIAHTDEGKTLFVEQVVPGDYVELEIFEDKKRFAKARVTQLLEASPQRVALMCSPEEYASVAPWAAISYESQLRYKYENIKRNLVHMGKLEESRVEQILQAPIPSPKTWFYRNKLELNSSYTKGAFTLGLHKQESNELLPIASSSFLPKELKGIVKSISGALKYASGSNDLGIERVGIRYSEKTKDLEVALWTQTGAFPRNHVEKILRDAIKAKSIVRVMLKDKAKTRKLAGVEVLAGKGHWQEKLLDNMMALSAPSFFQVNTPQAEKLIGLVLDYLDPQEDETIFDLYSGAGTFSIPLAKKGAEVISVESYGPAVKDLRRNSELNQVFVDVIGGDTARELAGLGRADKIVVDPPKSGLAKEVVEELSRSHAEKIVYVSCDPATLSRDIALFEELGRYQLEIVQPVDLFPQTFHVETVSLLTRRDTLTGQMV
ncbi:MAG: 23S rRNA (uracil(1939)-C(5))-methyltransferase RlmD [Coriobacteriia bacterium]|nr:23S rRNA (uracil(1939)-C(5))-methyltransferase RlmD [Coriobacteriia bacterium]